MLRYTKTILHKVSFNKELFKKELSKAVKWLAKDEVKVLRNWCILHFGAIHMDIINEVFR